MSFLRSIKAKITLAFTSTIAAWLILAAASLYAISTLDTHNDRLYSTSFLGVNALANTRRAYTSMTDNIRTRLDDASPSALRNLARELPGQRQTLADNWADYYPARVASPAERRRAQQAFAAFESKRPELDQFVQIARDGRIERARSFYENTLAAPLAATGDALDELHDRQLVDARQIHDQSNANASLLGVLIASASAIAIIVGLIIAVVLIRMIIRPLARAKELAESIGEGYLNNRIDHRRHDEFGAALDALAGMQHRLVETVADVRGTSEAVGASASQIASGSDELSSRTQRQAASLEQTAASMEQMTATVKQNADNAAEAETLAGEVRSRADDGGDVVKKAVDAMTAIDESSRKINDIVELIEDIAFQTNLLALNASVEAARAGEQGRGFAVVATEVRNLANRSASAVDDIKTLVTDSAAKVAEGSRQVALSGETLDKITTSVHQVNALIGEIAVASREQASGIEQVNLAVADMDSGTQENAALVEQSASAGRDLEQRSRELFEKMAFFKLADSQTANAPLAEPKEQLDSIPVTAKTQPEPSAKPRPATPATTRPKPSAISDNDDADWATF